jgi:hypothetical protein
VVLLALAGSNFWMWRLLEAERQENSQLRSRLSQGQRAPGQPDRAVTASTGATAPARQPSEVGLHSSLSEDAIKAVLGPLLDSADHSPVPKDPEAREAMRTQSRLSVEAEYADLVRMQKLPPELADRLFDLLVDQMFEALEGPVQSVSSTENGTPIPTPEYQALKQQQDRELAELIGERRLAQLKEYDETIEYRQQAKWLQLDIGGGADAMRDDQVEALIGIMRDANEVERRATPVGAALAKLTPEELQQLPAKTRDLRRQRDVSIRESAAAVLTPTQLAALDARLRRAQVQEDLSTRAVEKVMEKIGKALPPPATAN